MNRVLVSIANALARVGYVIAAALALYMFVPNARADALSDFLSVYKQIEKVAPSNALPLHSWDIEASKGLFSCLSSGNKNSALCIAEFHDTPLGQQASGSIPQAFWDFLDAYVAYIGHDYWGVAYHLGTTATCAALQVLMGGIDACSLIEELVDLAKDVYAGGKAVAEFFADFGEGTFKAAKAAYCATPLSVFGGCSKGGTSPKPKAVVIYDTYFKPNLSYGLQAIKSDNNQTLPTLVKAMKSQALAKGHASPDVDTAAGVFYEAVDVLWSEFVLTQLLPGLTQARGQYNDQVHVNEATLHAWQRYTKAKTLPPASVTSHCDDHFNSLGYGQFTRWIIAHAPKALELKVLTVHRWCDEAFWQGNQSLFGQAFLGPNAAGSVCPGLHCPTQKELALCQPFMATVGKKCAIAVSLPDGAAAKVDDKVVPPAAGAARWPAGGADTTSIAKPARADSIPPPAARAASTAPGQNRPSNWGAIGQPQNRLAVEGSAARGNTGTVAAGGTAVAQAANAATANASRIGADLAKVRCTAGADGLRFLCATREGFERCESMRARREVDTCVFNVAR